MTGTNTQAAKRCLLIVLLACILIGSQAAKVLVATTPVGKSHMMNLKMIAMEVERRGHSVMWVTMAADVDFLQPTNNTVVSYAMDGIPYDTSIPEWRIFASTPWHQLWGGLYGLMKASCVGLMSNQTALDQLQAYGADVMLAEMFTPCSALLAHKLDLPWINHWPIAPVEPFFTSQWSGSNRRLFQPNPLSYYPQFRSSSSGPTTQHMNLRQRMENFLLSWYWVLNDYHTHMDAVRSLYKRYDFDPELPEERRRQVMTIAPVDWAAEWLRPVTPNFKLVGSVLAGPGKPLPAHLEAFMSDQKAGKEGVVLASLGTIAELNQQQLRSMAAAFATLPCKILWRLTPKEVPNTAAIVALGLGNNTEVLTWVPQNDILAHPNLKAFLSHVGINSMYEAIYHGKPIVGMPFFGDQPSNADRVVAKGFGVQLLPTQAGKPAFREALLEVLTNPQYTKAAQALSVKIRARKNTPVQEAADWIEHVIATRGEPYLKTPEDEMSFIVRNSLDVHAILGACCTAFLLAARTALRLLYSKSRPLIKAWLNDKSLPWGAYIPRVKAT